MSTTLRSPLTKRRQTHIKPNPIGYIRLVVAMIALFFIAAAILDVHKVEVSREGSAIPEIKSGISGYCLDDVHDIIAQDTEVDTAACDGRASQDWTVSSNGITHDKYCLSVQNNGTSQNDGLVTDRCNGTAGQVWVSALGGYENPNSGMCLDVPDNQTNAQLVAASCNDLTESNEVWTSAIWSKENDHVETDVSCNSGTEGQQVACYAAKQWVIWQADSPSHKSLLNEYSDGNAYEEWCADFVSYIYRQAGYPFIYGERDGWDEYLADDVQYENFTYHSAASGYVPQPGDVAYFDYPGGHVEIVAVGGSKPVFIYGDSGTNDPSTGNGEMTENSITNDPSEGQVIYYLSPS
jgi:hypothetical protein